MAETRQTDEWNRAALLAVLIAEPNRDAKKQSQPFEIHHFHPFAKPPKRHKKSGAELLAKLCSIDGIQPEVVTEQTPWAQKVQT